MKLRTLAVLAVLGGLALLPAGALAAQPQSLWVAPAPTTTSPADASCAEPGYNTIQSAVDSAGVGAVIHICAGTYTEQVQITQSVSLDAVGAVTLALPATPVNSSTACDTASDAATAGSPDQEAIVICGDANVAISGLTVDAAWPSGTCNDNLYGILVAGGATLTMTDSSVTAAGAVPLNGCQGGIGIQVGMAWTTPEEAGHASLLDVSVSGYQKNGITVDGTGSSAQMFNVNVTGAGETTQIAQNGIQVSDGALGRIYHSSASGNECDVASCGANPMSDYQATGILFYGAAPGSFVTGSQLSGNDIGVYNYETSAPSGPAVTISSDTLNNDRYEGIALDQGSASMYYDHINGGNIGICVLQYAGQAFAADGTAAFNSISGESVAAVEVDSDNAPSDVPGLLNLSFNALDGNAARIVNTSSDYTVRALFNF